MTDPKLERFTPRAKKVVEMALREALSLGHNYIGTEHILLGLTRVKDSIGADVLKKDFAADHEMVRAAVVNHLVLMQKPMTEAERYREALRAIASTPASGSDVFRTQRMAQSALKDDA
jgi:ATP-dependent Clp protease ATP-binding subunit ClpA